MHKNGPVFVFSAQNHNCFHFPIPMERYFTRRAGPPTTEWRGREQHAEDDFLALVRHNAATKLGLEWPPVAKKRRVGKPSMDDQISTRGPCVTLWPRSRSLPRPCRRRSGQAGGAKACHSSLEVPRQMQQRPTPRWSSRSRGAPTTSHDENCGTGWSTTHSCASCKDGTTRRSRSTCRPGFRTCSVLGCRRELFDDGCRTTRRKEGRQPRDACDVLIPILRERYDRVGEAGVPISASVMQPIFNRVAEQHGITRRFGNRWTRHFLRCAGYRYRSASGAIKTAKDPTLVDVHIDKLRLRLTHYVTEYHVHPSCIINMDETAAKLMGLGHRGWARPQQDGRVRFIGAEDKRNLTISTVVTMTDTIMAQLIVEGTTKRVLQNLPEHEKISCSFSDSHWCTEITCRELIDWLGAWVRKRGFLHWVLLWDCASVHRKASLLEWIRTAHPECHVLFIPGGFAAELQPADISIQQSLKRIIREQAMQFFAESVCRDDTVLDLRLGTMKRLMAQWVIHACEEVEKKTHITAKAWHHLSWTFEEAPMLAERAAREHHNGTLFEKETELAEEDEPDEESDLILHDDDDDAEGEDEVHDEEDVVPESTGTAVAEAVVPSSTVAAEVVRAERSLYLRVAYGPQPPSRHDLGGSSKFSNDLWWQCDSQMRALKTEVEFSYDLGGSSKFSNDLWWQCDSQMRALKT